MVKLWFSLLQTVDSSILMIISIIKLLNLSRNDSQNMKRNNSVTDHTQFRHKHFISTYFVLSVPSELGHQWNLIGL